SFVALDERSSDSRLFTGREKVIAGRTSPWVSPRGRTVTTASPSFPSRLAREICTSGASGSGFRLRGRFSLGSECRARPDVGRPHVPEQPIEIAIKSETRPKVPPASPRLARKPILKAQRFKPHAAQLRGQLRADELWNNPAAARKQRP